MIQKHVTLYRLHFIDRRTGLIGHTYEFHAVDDLAAIEFSALWAEDAPMELWSRKGKLKRWEAAANDRAGPPEQRHPS